MQLKLLMFERNGVFMFVPRPDNANVIWSKWIFKNKTNESGNIIRNKARVVAQGYTEEDGVDFKMMRHLHMSLSQNPLECFWP